MNIQKVRSLGYKSIPYIRHTQIIRKELHTAQTENTKRKQVIKLGLVRKREA